MLPKRLRESALVKKIRAFTERYERFWIPLMLVGGIAGDVIQFRTLDLREKFIIQAVYVVVATCGYLLIVSPTAANIPVLRRLRLVAPFAHQFAVGGLLGTALLFYWFSGTLSVSWPVILFVAVLMMFNEFLRDHFLRPSVQVGVLYFCFFSLSAILLSFVVNSLSPLVFVASGILAFMAMSAYLVPLIRVGDFGHKRKSMFLTMVVIGLLMHTAYFLNVIPPIPLSLRDAGMYHNIITTGGDYTLVGEDESLLDRLLPGQVLHVVDGEPLYAYTSIFAPTDLSTTMVHKWQHYDETHHGWVTESALSFPIHGGRSDGYRGYSMKSHFTEGTWRVSVETTRGQVLGRIPFTVEFITP